MTSCPIRLQSLAHLFIVGFNSDCILRSRRGRLMNAIRSAGLAIELVSWPLPLFDFGVNSSYRPVSAA